MKLIWSSIVRSDTRTDKATGRPIEYRLTVFDDGQAACSCPAFVFQSINNPKVPPDQKLRYRCKHLAEAFASGRVPDQTDHPGQAAAETPMSVGSPAALSQAAGPAPGASQSDDDFDDDDEDLAPRVRR